METAPSTDSVTLASPPPNWVRSRHPLGWLIDRLLAVEPLRQVLFWQARRLIIGTAERRGIAWRERREALRVRAEPLLEASTNPATEPPAYYRAHFHAYNERPSSRHRLAPCRRRGHRSAFRGLRPDHPAVRVPRAAGAGHPGRVDGSGSAAAARRG